MSELTFGQYRVESQIGKGGMGVVYRAIDMHLNRPVAIKVLTKDALANPDKRKRFLHEARAASALNHPNIVHIYDIGQSDGVDYIAMEFVQGETLAAKMDRERFSLEEAVRLAGHIADALEAAHTAGIVHRDIKPGNIMVTPSGLVKLLDFGLAKLTDQPTEPESTDSHSEPTKTQWVPATTEGTVLGTAGYMAPEQALARKVDGRADIFATGAVLYELATGRRAFDGPNSYAVISAILTAEPTPLKELAPSAPERLAEVVHRCLRKEPADRYQNAGELRQLLREIKRELVSQSFIAERSSSLTPFQTQVSGPIVTSTGPMSPAPGNFSGKTPWVAAAAGTAALLAGLVWFGLQSQSKAPPAPTPLELSRLTADAGLSTDAVLSADGKLVTYASDRAGEGNLDIWMRQVAGGEPIRLTTDPAEESEPSFSPDGVQIAFRSEREGGGVYVVPTLGGAPRRLIPFGRNPRFSPDGRTVIAWLGERQSFAKTVTAPASGGEVTEFPFDRKFVAARYPRWSPDGRQIIFLGREQSSRAYDWWVAEVATGKTYQTGAFELFRKEGLATNYQMVASDWTPQGIVFSARPAVVEGKAATEHDVAVTFDTSNLYRVLINPVTWRMDKPPVRLTFGASVELKPSESANGRIAFSSVSEAIKLWGLPLPAAPGAKVARLSEDAAVDIYPTISSDGRRIAFASSKLGGYDIWLKDMATGRDTRLTTDPAFETMPMIAASGSRVAYAVMLEGARRSIRTVDVDAAGRPGQSRVICDECGYISDLSPDGSAVLSFEDPPKGVMLHDVAARSARTVLIHKRFIADPRFSPDGRWIAFHLINNETSRQVFVAPLRPNETTTESDWIPVTDGKGMDRSPAWAADGKTVYYLSESDGSRCIWSRSLDLATHQPSGPPTPVVHFHSGRGSMLEFANASMARMSAARDRIVFSLSARTGNVWLATPRNR